MASAGSPVPSRGFGAGTLADMSLMQLLLVQVPLLLVSAIHFDAAERRTQPFLSDPWSASTVSRLSSTRVHGSSSVVRGTCGPSHGWISKDQPMNSGQQNSRGADQAYIGTQHDGFVGFGAGTLADMSLMQLLLVQAGKNRGHLSRLGQRGQSLGQSSKIPDGW
ncbi:uncharacterized protein LOC142776738 isoform X2 [Rhipicephalus microplus]|uniref:uncharacterized protein LOC142776738 isoform X2 n=1 Tax=Rhipicephalus microplus TaxID=6941 RepID=UPI003F6AB347